MHDPLSYTAAFLDIYRQYHHPRSPQKQVDECFAQTEQAFLSVFQLGLFEIYDFLYSKCVDTDHFKSWIIAIKGQAFFDRAVLQFFELQKQVNKPDTNFSSVLTKEQEVFWQENGYLKIEQVINESDCNAVCDLICKTLNIDLNDPQTWYPVHDLLQGLMLQKYQDDAIAHIRDNVQIKHIFSSLYRNNNILANCEKVSYNPPVTPHFSFKGSPLHWDIDFEIGPKYYIQGLLYLNDVPANRGAFTLIPGFQHQIDEHLMQYDHPEAAISALRNQGLEIPVEGRRGDLIVWLQSIPHAASPNYSDLPRFVQYISFNEIVY
ncbi:phytanoyl-CoA dioxygenase family protein [Pedobacter rhizosphaerae]|uniref:Phytanoyl-CoA dioxygenase (PhyH) n=1 Tax=Pedobacter rhizosphaerae TaxID=390241 RepID=A0A1H9UUB0_9SPHI|nr:phytanoyl-CoA dioxygenase family protein [Pedobacter rhizosphaerae]SES13065.1 Phytanoyl-CoA dioxygenase (PhyH) [Pedobacter rhizosphaerae]